MGDIGFITCLDGLCVSKNVGSDIHAFASNGHPHRRLFDRRLIVSLQTTNLPAAEAEPATAIVGSQNQSNTMSSKLIQKVFFRIRERTNTLIFSSVRKLYWTLQGCSIGYGTTLPKVTMTWPHQVRIGRRCVLEHGIYFKFDGIWCPGQAIHIADGCFIGAHCEFNIRKGIDIGEGTLIGSGCKFIDHDHGIATLRIDEVPGVEEQIRIGAGVWLGANVIILKGIAVEDGAVVGAGSVVTKSIPPYEIWAGVPARKIGARKNMEEAPMREPSSIGI